VIGASTALAQSGSEVRGTVTTSETHVAVIGARVSVAAPERVAISDQRGAYTLRNLPAGTYRVITTAIGRKPDTSSVAVAAGRPTTLEISLKKVRSS
jgi:hypothetical protein